MSDPLLLRYLQPLLAGRRGECLHLIREAVADGRPASDVIRCVVWPAMKHVEAMYRDDRLNQAMENMASRINRTIAHQLQERLAAKPRHGKRMLIISSRNHREEISAEIMADLFEADGWDAFFICGGVPHDEIVTLLGELRPQITLIFGAEPEDVPHTRRLVEHVRDIGVCPQMNIVVTGGVFNRADGLWQEVGADIFAAEPDDVIQLANELRPREPNAPKHMGIVKKRRRKRKSATAGAA